MESRPTIVATVQARRAGIHPYHLLAYIILPDHFHWLMQVDDPSGNFSIVMRSIKANFTLEYKKLYGIKTPYKLWQARFWDHVIRDEQDLENHFDYIHWNPVKHGYVKNPDEWKHSSYQHWFSRGYYPEERKHGIEPFIIPKMDIE
jgi:putative transposase